MASTVYSEGASGDTTGSSYPLLTANATFSGQFDPARLVTSPFYRYESDSDYFGIPIGSSGVQPGGKLRFTVAGLPASARFAARYTYVSPGAKPDFSNVRTAIVGSSGVVDVPADVDPNAVLVLSLGDDQGASYGYSVAWSDGSASSSPSPDPGPVVTNPAVPAIAFPEPVGATASGDPVYDLGIGIANVAPVKPQLPKRSSLRLALRALLDVEVSEPSPGAGSISLDSWTVNGETVGSYDGPQSLDVRARDLPEGTSEFSASGTVDQTGERVDLQLPTTVTTGIVDEPYAIKIATDDVLANYLDSGKDVEHTLYYTNRGEFYAKGTTTRVVDTGVTTEELDISDLRHEGDLLLEKNRYDGAGTLLTTETSNRDGTSAASAFVPGQTLTAGPAATLTGNGVGQTDFVFTPGFGAATVADFLWAGPDHDTLELPATDFTGIGDVLRHTTMQNGAAVIVDPVSQDRIVLEHVTKGQLRRHPDVFTFS